MSWFKKKLKKITKVVDPIGAKLRKSTGGSYGDPMNWYQSKPKQATPYQAPPKRGLQPDPGTGGPTVNLGGGGNYTPNPFANQMAQAAALRQPNLASKMGGRAIGSQPTPGMEAAALGPSAPPPAAMMQPQQMQIGMVRGNQVPGMAF